MVDGRRLGAMITFMQDRAPLRGGRRIGCELDAHDQHVILGPGNLGSGLAKGARPLQGGGEAERADAERFGKIFESICPEKKLSTRRALFLIRVNRQVVEPAQGRAVDRIAARDPTVRTDKPRQRDSVVGQRCDLVIESHQGGADTDGGLGAGPGVGVADTPFVDQEMIELGEYSLDRLTGFQHAAHHALEIGGAPG